ncbi:MAG: hypothetical protein N3A69_00790 [Leptospiraceae bacterium]|nr:hypothetical protein [Leptospiraceae bacterium]
MKKSVISFVFFCISFTLSAQEKKVLSADELFRISLDEAFQYVKKLNKEEAKVLIDQIRVEAKKDYPNIEKFYLLISHLETIRAIEEEKSHLRDLHLVYFLGLVLFVSLLLYTLYSQKKALEKIKQYKEE